jgi:hypothetical protein
VLDVDEVEGRGNEIQAGQNGLPLAVDHDIAQDEIAQALLARVEDRVDRAMAGEVELVPALQPHQPDRRVGLRVEVDEEHPLAGLGQTSGDVDDAGGFPTPPL